MKTIVENNDSAIFYEPAEKYADYRISHEYGTIALGIATTRETFE